MRPMLGLLLAFGLVAQPVQAMVPGNPTEVATLRQEGPAALDRLLALRGKPGVDQGRLRRTIDAVARQKDAHASGLFWHTDLAAARATARAQGKPILSLRLLGNLDEARSCANSRLFRTVLYADDRVSALLRQRFVLHWQSVRPAPQVTIDFGDGRKLETTLTGNSLHYVLDASGRPIDALPGLYGADRFLGELTEAAAVAAELDRLSGRAWRDRLVRHLGPGPVVAARPPAAAPSAIEAARLTESKAVVELPVLEAMLPPDPVRPAAPAPALGRVKLGAGSLRLMREHLGAVPDFDRQVTLLEASIARDEVLNEARLRPAIAAMIRDLDPGTGLDALTDRIYAEVFKTPGSDPYLGLEAAALYNGLERNGLSKP